jgi:hypothetical protein
MPNTGNAVVVDGIKRAPAPLLRFAISASRPQASLARSRYRWHSDIGRPACMDDLVFATHQEV